MQIAGMGAAATVLSSCSTTVPPRKGKLVDPGAKLRIACVGCGGKGVTDIQGVAKGQEIVALCDVDFSQATKILKAFPDAPNYTDFRKMLEEMDDQIDAVTVSTPDHMHYAVGMAAIKRGKHVFIQKPIAHSIGEARELTEAARRHGVVSAMGNQGHAKEGVRLAREWVQAGVLGDVTEVHMWTQKLTDGKYRSALRGKVASEQPTPETLDWNLWTGTAPLRAYSSEYHPWKWRGWWDYGNGALGDIGCHTMDAAFYALDLGAPIAVTAETSGYNEQTYPDWSIITYEFPARGKMPPVKVVWYDGGKVPERPKELEKERKFDTRHGYYMIGSKATIYDQSEKCDGARVIPETKMKKMSPSLPPKTIPRVPDGNNFQEWVNACKSGPQVGSNFDYAGPLSEMVLLGNIAIRANGERIEWNSKNMKITNRPDLNKFVNPPHRKF